jgi:hypothetical protein
VITRDDLATGEEKLAAAARRAAAYRRADRFAIYAAIGAGAFMAFFIYVYLQKRYAWIGDYAVPMLTFVFGAALIAKHVAKVIMYRIDQLGDLPLFGDWSRRRAGVADRAVDTTEQWPPMTAVPRLDASVASDARRVLSAPLREGPSAFVSAGGRATTLVDKLPVGVVALTEAGFVFFPDAEPRDVETMSEITGLAWEFAKDAFKPLGVLAALGVGERTASEPSLPDWIARSMAHPEFFAFGWGELVEVRYSGNGIVTMFHEAVDMPRTAHVFAPNDPRWPVLLMKQRLHFEMIDSIRTNVSRPKAAELAPALLEQFRAIYGDRVDEHAAELYAELEKRVGQWIETSQPAVDAVAKKALAPVLPYYAKYRPIVDAYPILFEWFGGGPTAGRSTDPGHNLFS